MEGMPVVEIIIIGIGLAMDAFAVSVTSGITLGKMKLRYAMRIALTFGFFQAIMPIFGWLGGFYFAEYLQSVDHWIAFILLVLIGGKMIWESRKLEEAEKEAADPLNIYVLLTLAVATSIDALAVGVTLSMLQVTILTAAFIIGLITFGMCMIGVRIGSKFGHLFEKKVEVLGGLILIGIGCKILIEHLFFH